MHDGRFLDPCKVQLGTLRYRSRPLVPGRGRDSLKTARRRHPSSWLPTAALVATMIAPGCTHTSGEVHSQRHDMSEPVSDSGPCVEIALRSTTVDDDGDPVRPLVVHIAAASVVVDRSLEAAGFSAYIRPQSLWLCGFSSVRLSGSVSITDRGGVCQVLDVIIEPLRDQLMEFPEIDVLGSRSCSDAAL